MARTNTELYRRFQGELRPRLFRFYPLLASGIRTALKKKIPMLILFVPPAIATVVFCFIVYGKYAVEEGAANTSGLRGIAVGMASGAIHIEVKQQIAEFINVMRAFFFLTVAWYGSGLLAEDRRLGAHLLYFARPITRLDYFLGKFLTAAFFGFLTLMLPGLLICFIAAWSSPEWSFLEEEGDLVWRTMAFSAIWIVFISSLVLAVSSLVPRKSFALIGVFGFSVMSFGMGGVLGHLKGEYEALSIWNCLRRIRNWIFDYQDWRQLAFDVDLAFYVIGGLTAASLAIIAWRLRKLEVVA